ncbi:hypothetical protein HJC23_002124 [Cyclotella cryptica]|uniref:PsbP C-terminal domain-containing protein n=1 Tax=Cyclotella cryptica TaxID=29204 RepID=A0ABD3Q1D9_9STRA|eukprot:CCRYP_009674-RA/>CCRYP_009674-RA protein AED:0.11 eAED:0.09 QI:0/-1/0/1/-1/1/1/0/276
MATFFQPRFLALVVLLSSFGITIGFQNSRTHASLASFPSSSRLNHHAPITADQNLPMRQPSRRVFFQSLPYAIAASSVFGSVASFSPANAASLTTLEPYTDSDYSFRLSIPASWKKSSQTLSGRRRAVFFTANNDDETAPIDTLMYIAYTPIRDDFTSLSSFGSVDQVAQATILPKGELGGQSDDSQMLSATSRRNAYYFDYTSTPVVPVEAGSGSGSLMKKLTPLHFRTIFTLLPLTAGAGSTLVTITMQTTEEKYGGLKGMFDEIVDSFERVSI